MSDDNRGDVPAAPEMMPADVREELHQGQMTHEGQRRDATATGADKGQRMGAVEDEMTPVQPPMAGPGNLIGHDDADDDILDPRDELTPG